MDARCFAAKILEQIEIRSAFAPDRIIGRDRWKVMRIWESSLRDPEAVMCKLSLRWKVMRIWESSLRDPEAVMCKLSLKL